MIGIEGLATRNQAALAEALGRVRARLQGHASGLPLALREEPMDPESALFRICRTFGLTAFERDLLLLAALPEFEPATRELFSRCTGDPARDYPTLELAFEVLPEGHWSAAGPRAPLREWRLVELVGDGPLCSRRIAIDERALHLLAGVAYVDDRVAATTRELDVAGAPAPSQARAAEALRQAWARGSAVVQLVGGGGEDKRLVAGVAAEAAGLDLRLIDVGDLAAADAYLWNRETLLGLRALLIDADAATGEELAAAERFASRLLGPVVLSRKEAGGRPWPAVRVEPPTPEEGRQLWNLALGEELNGSLSRVRSQFTLSATAIAAVADVAKSAEGPLEDRVWQACQDQARVRLGGLGARVESRAEWQDLVLPEAQKNVLREIVAHVRQRDRVYGDWGWSRLSSRGLGITALFSGASGTGKTLAAEVLANELRLDLFRIDLANVVSKYIGETEKNLARVFEAAEGGGAILLFDEADALFGKRSEVKDSHDRYANLEISYLLQRMEAYRGLAILTTNLKGNLDPAFLRRLRFVVHFAFPDAAARRQIWERAIPETTPTKGLDPDRLAQLAVAGGNIRNIALGAAFLAAEADDELSMSHLLQAARAEFAKIERPLNESEVQGWR
jgi:AAA+ superfamily predicted ATPase